MPIPAGPGTAPGYCTVADLRTQLGDTGSRLDEGELQRAVDAASREIDAFTGRRFWLDTEPSTRLYEGGCSRTLIDDVGSLDDLEVATSADGSTFGIALAADAFELSPLGADARGEDAWAFWWLAEAPGGTTWAWARRIRVTARWGWSAVPAQVEQAAILRATNLFKRKDSPHGIAGFADFGAVRIRQDPDVAALLAPFVRGYGIA